MKNWNRSWNFTIEVIFSNYVRNHSIRIKTIDCLCIVHIFLSNYVQNTYDIEFRLNIKHIADGWVRFFDYFISHSLDIEVSSMIEPENCWKLSEKLNIPLKITLWMSVLKIWTKCPTQTTSNTRLVDFIVNGQRD